MTSSSHYGDARTWRIDAEEARADADELKEAEPKAIMLRILIMKNSPSGPKKTQYLGGTRSGV